MTFPLSYDDLFSIDLFGLPAHEKRKLHDQWLAALNEHHRALCPEYARICIVLGDGAPLPVRLFKDLDLRSFEGGAAKTMVSSGTTGQKRSKIYLDRDTSARQTKALSRIVASFTNEQRRMPMLVIDAEGTVKERSLFSARTAGIRGFSMMGRDVTFALRNDMSLSWDTVEAFAERHAGERVLVFGFTFIVWENFIEAARESNLSVDMDGVLIHGGGWKKLVDRAVSASTYADGVKGVLGRNMGSCDYYGMVEQTGSVCMECECGFLHVSEFSDVAAIDPETMRPVTFGQEGLLAMTSLLPTSYPGHILLTEDRGTVLGEDDCPCGRMGRYFKVYGRQKGAEVRGCSDTYEGR